MKMPSAAKNLQDTKLGGAMRSSSTPAIPALANDLSIKLSAGTRNAELCRRVQFVKAEAKVPAFVPFEIVSQAPVEVAAQIDAGGQQLAHLLDFSFQQPGTDAVLAVGHAVFQNVDGLVEGGKALGGATQALGIGLSVRNFNSAVALRLVRRDSELEKHGPRTAEGQSGAQAAVVIDADVVAGILHFVQAHTEFAQRKRSAPAENAFRKIVVEATVDKSREPAVDGRLPTARLEGHKMLRPANVGIGLQRMNRAIGGRVGETEVARHLRSLKKAALASGRKLAQKVAQRRINVGFVEGSPVAAQIA